MMSSSGTSGTEKIPILEESPSASRRAKLTQFGKPHEFRHSDSASDSDGSDDSVSMLSNQTDQNNVNNSLSGQSLVNKPSTKSSSSRKGRKARQEWEIIEGLKSNQRFPTKPERFNGYLLKRRKWPMKGWHKRFFVLEKGILTYAKSPSDIEKGKLHGVIDIGLSVICFKRKQHRIDIDAEELVHHIKIKDRRLFEEWLEKVKHHRLYRQHEIAYGTKDSPRLTDISPPNEEMSPIGNLPGKPLTEQSHSLSFSNEVGRPSSLKNRSLSFMAGSSQGRVAAWLLDSAGIEYCDKEFRDVQSELCELEDLLNSLKQLPLSADTICEYPDNLDYSFKKKSGPAPGLRIKKRHYRGLSTPMEDKNGNTSGSYSSDRMHVSSSNPNLANYFRQSSFTYDQQSPVSPCEQTIDDIKQREKYFQKAKKVQVGLKSLYRMISTERERLKRAFDEDHLPMHQNPNTIASLKQSLNEALKQNQDLRSRLSAIHTQSAIPDLKSPSPAPLSPVQKEKKRSSLVTSMSAESCSVSEYYDAEEFHESNSDTSSEPSDDDEVSSEISEENDTEVAPTLSVSDEFLNSPSFQTGRRCKLPVPKPDTGDISLWSLLYKNIGKDLSKISMPVTMNEPLSMVQRLCEELEYSDLLDKAVECEDSYERMTYIAAFAMSSYASSYHRAGHKPFNSLLGETYECIREDRGWRFIAEQVSHHPPISTCYCESKNFVFWQDTRIKTKFWGKSMEIQPVGTVNLYLPKFKELYKWNKVTTCVHNILGGQRWVDQYGEMQITNGDIVCKMTFTKSSQWSSKRHEIYGHIKSPEGNVIRKLFGKWNEALYCGHSPSAKCIWRPGAMPDDYEMYYGFSRFAIELNEIDQDQVRFIAPTDSRFRPDQRMLEEGRIQEAENEKLRLEQHQRDRRKIREQQKIEYEPKWFRKSGKDAGFEYSHKYWEQRKDPGFMNIKFLKLW